MNKRKLYPLIYVCLTILLIPGCAVVFNYPLTSEYTTSSFDDGYWILDIDGQKSVFLLQHIDNNTYKVSILGGDKFRTLQLTLSSIGEYDYISIDLSTYREYQSDLGKINQPFNNSLYAIFKYEYCDNDIILYPISEYAVQHDIENKLLNGEISGSCNTINNPPAIEMHSGKEQLEARQTFAVPVCSINLSNAELLRTYIEKYNQRIFQKRHTITITKIQEI